MQRSTISNENLVNKSLKYSFLDGVFASGMTGFIQDYFTPFLLLLGATNKHVGMLSALPNLFSSLVQFKSADLTEKLKSRRKIIGIFVFLQALMLFPIAVMALLGLKQIYLFIALVVLFAAFGAFAGPAWGSHPSTAEQSGDGDPSGLPEPRKGEVDGGQVHVLGSARGRERDRSG